MLIGQKNMRALKTGTHKKNWGNDFVSNNDIRNQIWRPDNFSTRARPVVARTRFGFSELAG